MAVREAVKAIHKGVVRAEENPITEKLPHGDSRDDSTFDGNIQDKR